MQQHGPVRARDGIELAARIGGKAIPTGFSAPYLDCPVCGNRNYFEAKPAGWRWNDDRDGVQMNDLRDGARPRSGGPRGTRRN